MNETPSPINMPSKQMRFNNEINPSSEKLYGKTTKMIF